MRSFPAEFSALLHERGRDLIERGPEVSLRKTRGTPIALFDGVMAPSVSDSCVRLLDRHLLSKMRPIADAIPRDSIRGMTRNYAETLPKTFSIQTCLLWNRRNPAYETGRKLGLVSMMQSASLHRFAELATGLTLGTPTVQVICYFAGDYSGPHNDHHPEHDQYNDGYVDVHIMFGNDAVAHHWLVYEQNRHFREIRNVNLRGGIAVYRLPFWHYTTPLAAKPGRERDARRWLLLASYEIVKK
jgi:hypothetical protein